MSRIVWLLVTLRWRRAWRLYHDLYIGSSGD
jgi:hypothetical protein